MSSQPPNSPTDSPITSSEADTLGRAHVAHEFAKSIRELDASDGLVAGVLGPWGYGKSSFINLMKEEFASEPKLTVVDFNPWMFSGSDQLVNFFFSEIGAQLNVKNESKFGKAADWFAKYAGVLRPATEFIPIPFAGAAGEALAAFASGIAETTNADRSASKLRAEITKELAELDQPIVVVIDDIDRLTTTEIREIFKLVRLTASFPNIIYVLAFDRERVEKALAEDGIPGRAYLEKIVLLSFDIPQIPEGLLRAQVFSELDRVLNPLEDVELDVSRWGDVYMELIDPLLSNMRDVTRYAVSSRSTVISLGREVELVDVLALEAIRIFRPELMKRLSLLRRELTSTSDFGTGKNTKHQEAITKLLQDFEEDAELVRRLVDRLFPAALQHITNNHYGSEWKSQWRAAHRTAHIDYLNLYLDRIASGDLVAFKGSEEALLRFGDQEELALHLASTAPDELEDVIEGLTGLESKFTDEMVIPASIALLNQIDKMPDRAPRSFFDLSRPDMTVGRVTLRLLRRVEDEARREEMSAAIIEGIDTFSSRLDFIESLGYKEGSGHKLVSEAFASQIEDAFVQDLKANPPTDPAREWNAFRCYYTLMKATDELPLSSETDAEVLLATLRSAKSTARSHSEGSRQIRSEDHLAWDSLAELFGGEPELRNAITHARETGSTDDILNLAEKYASGWRPKR